MGQLTIYLPEAAEKAVKQAARKQKTTVSAYLARLVLGAPKGRAWPKGYRAILGSWEGDFPEAEDPPPDDVDAL